MQDLIFVHGMFQNPESWNQWISFFSDRGYRCLAPAWPYHEGLPEALRARPPQGLGELRFDDVLERMQQAVAELDQPIMIGHSVGGLVTQLFLNRGLIKAGIAINPVAPNAMFELDWDFIRIGASFANPLKGDEPIYMDAEAFHTTFANALSEDAAREAYEEFATHDSRNVLRGCLGKSGHVDFDLPHRPLLLISAELDKIIPAELVEKNFHAYTDKGSVTSYRNFAGRSHFICGEPGWAEVAAYAATWLEQTSLDPVGPVTQAGASSSSPSSSSPSASAHRDHATTIV